MKSLSMVKRLAVAAVSAAALAGPVTAAHALQFNAGDVVLTVYGNGTEYAANIGTLSNLINNGVNIDLSAQIATLQVGGNPLRYTVASYNGSACSSRSGSLFVIFSYNLIRSARHLPQLPERLGQCPRNCGGCSDPLSGCRPLVLHLEHEYSRE
jgi:hypothetical protein